MWILRHVFFLLFFVLSIQYFGLSFYFSYIYIFFFFKFAYLNLAPRSFRPKRWEQKTVFISWLLQPWILVYFRFWADLKNFRCATSVQFIYSFIGLLFLLFNVRSISCLFFFGFVVKSDFFDRKNFFLYLLIIEILNKFRCTSTNIIIIFFS